MKRLLMPIIAIFLLNGCGAEESSETPVDIAEYMPKNNLSKEYTDIKKINGDKRNRHEYVSTVIVESNLITSKRDNLLESITTVNDDEVNVLLVGDINRTKIYKRKAYLRKEVSNYVSWNESTALMLGSQKVGEESIKVEESCTYDSKIDKYEIYFFEYNNHDGEHDIIKLKCTSTKTTSTIIDANFTDMLVYENGTVVSKENISYVYFQKGLGVIATIDDDCIVAKSPDVIDDTANKNKCIGEQYHRVFYYPEY